MRPRLVEPPLRPSVRTATSSPRPVELLLRPRVSPSLRLRLLPLRRLPRLRRPLPRRCRRLAVWAPLRSSRWARALSWWAVASWPVGSSGSNGKHLNEYRGGTVRPRPYSFGIENATSSPSAVFITIDPVDSCKTPRFAGLLEVLGSTWTCGLLIRSQTRSRTGGDRE